MQQCLTLPIEKYCLQVSKPNLYYLDLRKVARMIVDLCQKSISNAFIRKKHESETNIRLLEKHERIESIAANLKSNPELEESEELQIQLQEYQDMVSTKKLFITVFSLVHHTPFLHSQLMSLVSIFPFLFPLLFLFC